MDCSAAIAKAMDSSSLLLLVVLVEEFAKSSVVTRVVSEDEWHCVLELRFCFPIVTPSPNTQRLHRDTSNDESLNYAESLCFAYRIVLTTRTRCSPTKKQADQNSTVLLIVRNEKGQFWGTRIIGFAGKRTSRANSTEVYGVKVGGWHLDENSKTCKWPTANMFSV
jgi:hypothetical protein